jgi:PAS domain S-box-containing protein
MSIHENTSDRIESVSFARDIGPKQLANAIPQLVWMANPDGQIHWYNDRWYDYTGISPEDSQGWNWQSAHDPEVLPEVLKRWNRSIQSGNPFQMTFPLRGRDGIFRPFFTLVTPLKDSSGKVLQWFGTNTDVSSLEEKEHALRQALDELREESRRKDEFLAMLGHELRNPLAPISAAAHLLSKLVLTPASSDYDQERARQAVQIILRQTKNLVELVNDLLDVSRVIWGLVQLKKENLDLKYVLSSAIEQVGPLLAAKCHALKASLGPEAVPVHGDSTRLIQVIVNLLDNAIKYTPPGGEIVLGVAVQDAEVEISVADSGVGIDQSLLPGVFDLFTQAERTLDRSEGGLVLDSLW